MPRSVRDPRAIAQSVQELWRAEGFNVCHFKSLLWWDRTEKITLAWHLTSLKVCNIYLQQVCFKTVTFKNIFSSFIEQIIGESNGTPLQYSCLENPMDGGAWWAAVHGVAKSWHDWATSVSLFTFMHWRRKWQPTPVFLPGESRGQRSLVGCCLWGRTESDMTEAS